ncbi:MAG: sulfite exporter TauE/SafE family protein [Candidatus Methanomethyliaceae archaeon]|nr:sulfite exporter TauE/SafE family protein [Candidatus Methanomethyliaceae archaeon]
MEFMLFLLILLFGIFAGALGATLGLGGGILMLLFFTLALNIPIHRAVALSLLAVIASSSMAGSVYVRDKMTNIRLAMVLETCTVPGAVLGAFLALTMPGRYIEAILAAVLIYAAIISFRQAKSEKIILCEDRLGIGGEYYDEAKKTTVRYSADRLKTGLFASFLAGIVSGVVGIGGGIIKVPIMNFIMKIPIKASAATSNFMVGVTAAASAVVYFSKGVLDLQMSVPNVLGIMVGAYIGTRLLAQTQSPYLRILLGLVLLFFSFVMFLKAGGALVW